MIGEDEVLDQAGIGCRAGLGVVGNVNGDRGYVSAIWAHRRTPPGGMTCAAGRPARAGNLPPAAIIPTALVVPTGPTSRNRLPRPGRLSPEIPAIGIDDSVRITIGPSVDQGRIRSGVKKPRKVRCLGPSEAPCAHSHERSVAFRCLNSEHS